jgi:FtsP/CotA-like multicopper oxidase with cupredoxin domain
VKLLMAVVSSISATALGLSLVAFVVAAREPAPTAAATPVPAATPAPAGPAVTTLSVALGDLFIEPKELTVPQAGPVRVQVTNGGGITHDLALEGGPKTPELAAGQSATLDLGTLEDGVYTLFCSIPGHRDAGMVATLHVGDAAAHGPQGRTLHNDDAYMAGVSAFPAATEGLGGQLLEPRIEDGVKVFELTASEFPWEVEPGVFRDAMGYNGQVPGPEIRVQLGDRVRVILHNELRESSSIHFHGLVVPFEMDGVPGLTQPLVLPGESWTYEFTVRNSGSHMYHSHMNGAMQIPAGLLGAFIVEGPDDPAVDQDIVMILNDGPLGYTLNGKGFPATQPIVASLGEQVLIRYMNEGLQIHPMHLHGMPQRVIARDGYPLEQPYLADTVLVAPGERVDVIVDVTEPGLWAFHCHILTHAEGANGMFGMVTVFIVQ